MNPTSNSSFSRTQSTNEVSSSGSHLNPETTQKIKSLANDLQELEKLKNELIWLDKYKSADFAIVEQVKKMQAKAIEIKEKAKNLGKEVDLEVDLSEQLNRMADTFLASAWNTQD